MEGSATKGLGFKDSDADIGKRRLDLDLPHPSRSATKGLELLDLNADKSIAGLDLPHPSRSATKGLELKIDIRRFPRSVRYAMRSVTKDQELRNRYADIYVKSRHSIVSRIYVEGYDTSLSGHDFVYSMRAHFASCGEVMLVYIPGYVRGGGRSIGNRFAFVYLRGEGAEERALKLHGSYMGEHKLVVEPYPFHATYLDHKLAPMREADNKQQYTFFVEGYDTSLPLDYVKGKLYEHFSKCGSIRFISVTQKEHGGPLPSSAYTAVDGIDTMEKVLQLGRCDVKGLENISISRVAPPEPDEAFLPCIHPAQLWACSSSKTPSAMAAAATAPEDPNLPEPPCMSTLLPYPYNLRFKNSDDEFKKLCYASQPASVKRYAPEDPSLPEPWKRLASSNTYSYYWNTETNVTQYERPPSSPRSCRPVLHGERND